MLYLASRGILLYNFTEIQCSRIISYVGTNVLVFTQFSVRYIAF
jgi:hypothetical protein